VARRGEDELIFLPLGGVGEIGMNAYLYGLGSPRSRQWLMVDLGITFPGEREPGIDVILPDIRFIEEERTNLAGLLLTHAHEDHFGAVSELWPRLGVDIYATPFTAQLLRVKHAENGGSGELPITEVPMQARFQIGPFDIELITLAHSIPEPNGVVIRSSAGTVFHTGDWKLDADPVLGAPTDAARIQEIGEEGLDAIICDSTNATRAGSSPSEAEVAETLKTIVAQAKHRVAVTTFASNVARIRSVIEAAKAADRHVVVVGRAMHRIIQVARETGHISPDYELLTEEDYGYLPREKVVALCTGSQGEPRGALARIANDDHPAISFAAGDLVVFSSRTIPGNEKSVGWVQNNLINQGLDLITDSDALVHVSGHPRRDELKKMYQWARPRVAVPMHGEARHLAQHAALARAAGVKTVIEARNGDIVRLLPKPAEIIDEAPTGRLFRDGNLIIPAEANAIAERRRLSRLGVVTVSIVLTATGELAAEPRLFLAGLPDFDGNGRPMREAAMEGVMSALDGIPRPRRKDSDLVSEAVRRGLRAGLGDAWGKRPICAVMVSIV